jgi:hypothetical protein
LGLIRTENWRKLHNDELRDLYSSPNTIKVIKPKTIRIAGHVTHTYSTKERRGGYRVSSFLGGGGAERMRQLERSKRRWEDNIRMDLK